MRILFVCGADFSAPSEKQALGFAQELVRRGHRVLISMGGDLDSAGTEGAIEISGLQFIRHRLRAYGRRLGAPEIQSARNFRPTLIHSFSPRLPVITAAAAYSGATDAPVFVHYEDDEWSIARGAPGEQLHRRAGRPVLRQLGRVLPRAWPFQSAASERWIATRARGIDALTPALAEHVAERVGRHVEVVLPVTPAVEKTAPGADLIDAGGVPVLLYTGAVFGSHIADFRLGLRAVALAQQKGCSARLVHAGALAPRFDPADLVRESGLRPGTAQFLGHLPFSAMPRLLAAADVLLQPGHPSDFNRLRLPSKLQSYLASGTPTVTFAVGFGELLADRREVLKTYTGDPQELAARILELLEHEPLRRILAHAGPVAARRLFDPAQNTDVLLAHYDRCTI